MDNKPNRTFHTALRVVLMTAALLSMAGTASAERILRVATHAGLSKLDPIWTNAYITRNHGYMIYDTLFAMDESFEIPAADGRQMERERGRTRLHLHSAGRTHLA